MRDSFQERQTYQKQYLMKNRPQRKEYFRKYYLRHREEMMQQAITRYYAKHKENREVQKKYRQDNKAAIAIMKKQGITITQAREQLKGG